jgi:hypothetical protein
MVRPVAPPEATVSGDPLKESDMSGTQEVIGDGGSVGMGDGGSSGIDGGTTFIGDGGSGCMGEGGTQV